MSNELKNTVVKAREINTSVHRTEEAISLNRYNEVFGQDMLSQQVAQNMMQSTQGIFSERFGVKIPKKLESRIESEISEIFVRQKQYQFLELSKRADNTKEKIKTQKHLMKEQNAFLTQRAEDMDVQRKYIDNDTAEKISGMFSEEERTNMQALLVGDDRTSTKMISHLTSITRTDDVTMLGDEYMSILELINENIDIKAFEFSSDQKFASEYAKKYELICKGASAEVFLKRVESLVGSGQYPLAGSLAGIQAKIDMCKHLKVFYEDMVAVMSSPYYALLEDKDLEGYLGDDWEQKLAEDVKAAHSDAFKEFVRKYRNVRLSDYGKNKKLADMTSAMTQAYKESPIQIQPQQQQAMNEQVNAQENEQKEAQAQDGGDEGEEIQTRKRRNAHANKEAMSAERNAEIMSHERRRRNARVRRDRENEQQNTQKIANTHDMTNYTNTRTLKTRLDEAGEGKSKEFKAFKNSFIVFYNNIEQLAEKAYTRQIDTAMLQNLINQCNNALELSKVYTAKGQKNNRTRQAVVMDLSDLLSKQVRRLNQSLANPYGRKWTFREILSNKPPVPEEVRKEREEIALSRTKDGGIVSDVDEKFYKENGGASVHMTVEKEEAEKVVKSSMGYICMVELKDHPGLYELRPSLPETVKIHQGTDQEETVICRKAMNAMFRTMVYAMTDENGKLKKNLDQYGDESVDEVFEGIIHRSTLGDEEFKKRIDEVLRPYMKKMLTEEYRKKGQKNPEKLADRESKELCESIYKLQQGLGDKDYDFTSNSSDTNLCEFVRRHEIINNLTLESFKNNERVKNLSIGGVKITEQEMEEIFNDIKADADMCDEALKEVREMDLDTEEACLFNSCHQTASTVLQFQQALQHKDNASLLHYNANELAKRHPKETMEIFYKDLKTYRELGVMTSNVDEDLLVQLEKDLMDMKKRVDENPDVPLTSKDISTLKRLIVGFGKLEIHRASYVTTEGNFHYSTEGYAPLSFQMFGEPFSLRGGVGKYSGKIKREHEGIKTDVGFCEGMENYYDLDNPVVSSRKEALRVAIKQIYIENFK